MRLEYGRATCKQTRAGRGWQAGYVCLCMQLCWCAHVLARKQARRHARQQFHLCTGLMAATPWESEARSDELAGVIVAGMELRRVRAVAGVKLRVRRRRANVWTVCAAECM